MSPPTSDLFKVQEIPNAGRGVIASKPIPACTVVLDSDGPAAHVIFRQYRKEVCAHCFEYDRGRTLPVRDNETGKVFCSSRCQTKWSEQQGELGLMAWRALHTFVQGKSKAILDVYSIAPSSRKPGLEEIQDKWQSVGKQAAQSVAHVRDGTSTKGHGKTKHGNFSTKVDPDILGFLLTGILFHYNHPEIWQEDVLGLAMDETPYKSTEDLEAHCNSFLQLHRISPPALRSSCSTAVCRMLANVGSHNAFGIRSGSDDGEEYMGYSLYTTASYFNHSCAPNITKRRLGRSWEFWSARDIEEGEECCISYLGGDEKDLTVVERRARLMEVWGFECMCERCQQEAKA